MLRRKAFQISLIFYAFFLLLINPFTLNAKSVGSTQELSKANGLPQFDYHTFPQQIFWLLILFIIFYILLSVFFIPKVRKIKDKRHIYIDEKLFINNQNLKKIAELKSEMHKMKIDSTHEHDSYLIDLHNQLMSNEEKKLEEIKSINTKKRLETFNRIKAFNKEFAGNMPEYLEESVSKTLEMLNAPSLSNQIVKNSIIDHLKTVHADPNQKNISTGGM